MNYQFVSHLESNVPSKVMKDLLLDGKEVNPFGKSGLTAENYRIVKEKKEVSELLKNLRGKRRCRTCGRLLN